ncbi:MAG: FapA family protein [Candidatus Zixiibacteriota bacterium]
MQQPVQNNTDAERTTGPPIRVIITPNKMSAIVRIPWPAEGDAPITVDSILNAIKEKNVTYGINNDAIQSLINESKFDVNVEVAVGLLPQPGQDAKLEYRFEEIQTLQPTIDADGRIDYKDINFVRTADKGQVLAIKTPAQEGISGINVHGEEVSAPSGRELKIVLGQNTRWSEDGLQIIADADGSIVTTRKQISVSAVQTIGGVNTQTGNIKHNGSLIIKGSVEANFEVSAKGDIEIYKNVADAKVISGGNIMVKGGFLGSRNGLLQALGDVHCKYVNDQVIKAGQSVFVGGEVFNSLVSASHQIHVTGSKGRIVGGKVQAKNEVKATCLGSDAGTRTEIQVAYDSKLMNSYREIKMQLEQLDENLQRVDEGLVVLYRQQLDNALSPQKLAALQKLEEFKKGYPQRKQDLNVKKADLEKQIQQNQQARIIAVQDVYPGVIIQFGIIYKEIKDKMGPSYFCLENNTIVHKEYRPGK